MWIKMDFQLGLMLCLVGVKSGEKEEVEGILGWKLKNYGVYLWFLEGKENKMD